MMRKCLMKVTKKTDKKIVIVGPVYPYKGGISHYTGILARSLSERYDTTVVSYSMQYPKLLFKKEQRDYTNDSFKFMDTRYWLNTANPFNIIATAGRINALKPDLVIVEWWHPYFAPCYIMLTRLIRAKVMFTCHNVFPHERFPLDRLLTKMTLKRGDYFVLHSEKEAAELCTIVEKAKYAVNMHPTYSAFNFHTEKAVESDKKTLLFFGFVRPYKGLKYILEALKELDDVYLKVVGDFGGSRPEYDELIDKLGIGERVEIHDGYTPDREVEKYFVSCDAVVLPYTDATQSGIAQIAFGFEKPVIATRVGGLPEVVIDEKTGVLCRSEDARDLSRAVRHFYELKNSGVDFEANIRVEARRFSWEHMVDTISDLASLA
ncbi:MAG: glycosyltransferase [Lachnospiraceae bacterium]|nr:glycosyltransferase [Lachnospiraceae bacterium]